jgi:large subunit ribosomal protein L21
MILLESEGCIFMYALIEFKGKQYKAEKGALLKVDRIDAEPGAALEIDSVLLVSPGDTGAQNTGGQTEAPVTVGTPYVKGVKVSAKLESHEKGDKIIIFKYKPKKDYRRKQGHRQQYSIIRIEDIIGA